MSLVSKFKTPEGATKYLAAYDATLAEWPIPSQAIDVTTSFGTTHINVTGSANLPPLILLHGFAFSSTQWYPNIAALSQHFRVYAPDVIDQVGKSISTRPVRTRQNYAAWLIEVLDSLKLERATIAGHSHGGWLALNLALAAPQRVEQMILLSPGASFAPIAWQFQVRTAPAVLLHTRPLIFGMLQWMNATPLAYGQPFVEQYIAGFMYSKLPPPSFPTVFTDAELQQISISTLLLVGEYDGTYKPNEVLERGRRLIPHIQAELVPGGGHAFPLDHAELTNARMLAFLGCQS